MKRLIPAIALFALPLFTNGCVVVAAAGAGYVIHDEATENDGNFDPLEDVRGEGDGKN